MHSRLLVSGLPRSLPPLPRSLAPPCLPCVEGRQRTAPHSSSFPPTTAPLQTLHMDVWGPARITGQGGERYFLLVVNDYTRYTKVFPLHSRADVRSVLIRWIRAVRLQLRAQFREDLPILWLHSDRGGEFCSRLLEGFCGAEGIVQLYTLLASPQQNGIAERRIGLVMEVARTFMIHAAAPHFLWPFAVRYVVEKLNLWPRVSHPETSPTLRWAGKVGDASVFRVWGSLSLVRDLPAGKLSSHTLWCVFLSFPTNAWPWQFYHLGSRRVLSSRGVTFDESDCFYRLHPRRNPPPLVEPLEVSSDTSGPAEGGDQTATDTVTPRRSTHLVVPPGFPPRPSSPPLRPVAVDSGAARGGDTGGADSGGAGSRGAASPTGAGGAGGVVAGVSTGRGASGACAGTSGAGTRRQETLSPERLHEWAVRWGSPSGDAGHARAAESGGAGSGDVSAGVSGVGRVGGTGVGGTCSTGGTGGAAAEGAAAGTAASGGADPRGASAGVPGVGRAGDPGTGGTGGAGLVGASAFVPPVGGTGGADTRGTTGGTGFGGASWQESLSPQQLRAWAVRWGSPGGGAGGAGSVDAVSTGTRGSGGVNTQPHPSALRHLLSLPPAAIDFPTRASTPVRGRRVVRPRAPAVPSTHRMALRPSSVPQRVVVPSPPASSLPHVPDPEPHLVRTASPTVTRLLATVVTDHSFESAAASALVAELVDLASLCRLDYAASLVFDSSYPPSVRGELALSCDVLEDKQFELECLAATTPHLASTLLFPEGDLDALDIPTSRTYAEAITCSYSSQWQIAMDAEMASWKSTSTYVDKVPPPGANIVEGMWIFRRPPGSPRAFKVRYVAQGFSQREGVDFLPYLLPHPKDDHSLLETKDGAYED
ncbi:unnamed protein product [Closterium sp. NIES-53]